MWRLKRGGGGISTRSDLVKTAPWERFIYLRGKCAQNFNITKRDS